MNHSMKLAPHIKFVLPEVISVLLPARGRPAHFRAAIKSLYDLAAQPDKIEILVRLDRCDTYLPDLERTIDEFNLRSLPFFVEVGPRMGYRHVFEHYNELAAASHGGWLINWNDDVEMVTSGWDDLLRQAHPHSIQFLRRDILPQADTTFPVTGRSVYEAMGHLALQVHADDWMRVVARDSGVGVWRNDIVFHHHRLNDQTSYDRDHGGYDTEGFNSVDTQKLIAEDVCRVRAANPRNKE